jgi:hypothetical protein
MADSYAPFRLLQYGIEIGDDLGFVAGLLVVWFTKASAHTVSASGKRLPIPTL